MVQLFAGTLENGIGYDCGLRPLVITKYKRRKAVEGQSWTSIESGTTYTVMDGEWV